MSLNQKTHKKSVEKGLSIYKTGRSKFWQARLWDRRSNKYVEKSTREEKRLNAATVAREWKDDFLNQNSIYVSSASSSDAFEYYARMIPISDKDDWILLKRADDGILAILGDYRVTEITTAVLRSYINIVNNNREKPLAVSTQKKHIITIRKSLRYARENGKITQLPESPKLAKQTDNPRPSFTDLEFIELERVIHQMAKEKAVVQGYLITSEYRDFVYWITDTFVRPTVRELFEAKVEDCKSVKNPQHIELTVRGKTGYRISASMPEAVDTLTRQICRHNLKNEDYLWFPGFENRSWAMRKAGVVFNAILDRAGLRYTWDGQKRSLYSLRHYALGLRLRESGGKVNIYSLAKNAGTSVGMLTQFYLKNLPQSPDIVRNIQAQKNTVTDFE